MHDEMSLSNAVEDPRPPAYTCRYGGRSYYISARMMDGIKRYVDQGKGVGDFLQAVICHDLWGAVGHADDENRDNLPAYCAFFHNHVPADCHGSREKYKAWIKKHADAMDQLDKDMDELAKDFEPEPQEQP
jgi:hypothetical protein